MKKKSIAYYIFDEYGKIVKVVSKSALTRSKKRMSLEAGAFNHVTARNVSEVEKDEVALDEGHPIPEPSEEKKGKWKKVKKKELLTGHTMTEKGGSYTRPDSPPEMVYRYKTPKSKKKKDNWGITCEVGEWKLKDDHWKYCPHCGKELK